MIVEDTSQTVTACNLCWATTGGCSGECRKVQIPYYIPAFQNEDPILAFCVNVLSEAGILTLEEGRLTFQHDKDDPGNIITWPPVVGLRREDLHHLFVQLLKYPIVKR